MPDIRAAAEYLGRQRGHEAEAATRLEKSKQLMLFIGMTGQASIGTAGIGILLWQSARAWGSLPAATGVGLLLYAGVGLVMMVLWIGAAWAWSRWREPL